MIGVVRFLPSCKISGPPSPAQGRLIAALDASARFFHRDIWVTCLEDSHGPADPHTHREAVDIKTIDDEPADVRALYDFLRHDLGPLWTVLYESPKIPGAVELNDIWYPDPNATGPHIHVQSKMGTPFPRYPPADDPTRVRA